MGVLADLIVADIGDMQAVVESEYPLGAYKGGNVDGLDPLMLAELHALVTGQSLQEVLAAYRPEAQASEQGPWLIHVPAAMVHQLADLPPQDHPALAARWVAGTRMQEQARDGQWAEQMLERTAFQAQSAAFEGKELFLVVYD
jgi:hypothetical protein